MAIVACHRVHCPAVISQAARLQAVNHEHARLRRLLLLLLLVAATAFAPVSGAVSPAAGLGGASVCGGGLWWQEGDTACISLQSDVHNALKGEEG